MRPLKRKHSEIVLVFWHRIASSGLFKKTANISWSSYSCVPPSKSSPHRLYTFQAVDSSNADKNKVMCELLHSSATSLLSDHFFLLLQDDYSKLIELIACYFFNPAICVVLVITELRSPNKNDFRFLCFTGECVSFIFGIKLTFISSLLLSYYHGYFVVAQMGPWCANNKLGGGVCIHSWLIMGVEMRFDCVRIVSW